MRHLVSLLRQCRVVKGAGGVRVEREIELVLPTEIEACARERIVACARPGVSLGEIGGMGSDLVGDDAGLDVIAIGEPEMLLGCDVAEHGGSEPADHRCADGRGDVVVAGGNVGGERTEGVERRLAAGGELLVHVLLDLVHRYMARTLDHHLAVVCPGDAGELPECLELGELGSVVGVGDRAGAQPIPEREADIVGTADLADLGEVLVKEALAVMGQAPLRHDRAATRDDTGDAVDGQRDVRQAYAGVNGEVVDALLRLLDEGIAIDLPGEVLGHARDFLERLIDRNRADRHR